MPMAPLPRTATLKGATFDSNTGGLRKAIRVTPIDSEHLSWTVCSIIFLRFTVFSLVMPIAGLVSHWSFSWNTEGLVTHAPVFGKPSFLLPWYLRVSNHAHRTGALKLAPGGPLTATLKQYGRNRCPCVQLIWVFRIYRPLSRPCYSKIPLFMSDNLCSQHEQFTN